MSRSFKETIASLKNPKMFFLFILGISSGLPFALTLGTLQAWMSEPTVNVSLKTIGLFAFLRLPYSLKFMWSPLMDRFSLPFLDRRRGWVLLTQILIAITLVGLSIGDPQQNTIAFMIVVLFCNFFSASQDIVLDAYRREILNDDELGLGSGVFIDGYLVSFRYISGAGAILLSSFTSWQNVYLVMALLMLVLILGTIKAPKINFEIKPPLNIKAAFLDPIKEFFSRQGAITILVFIVLYKIGDNMASTMTVPFILKNGFSKEEYVAVVKVWGLVAVLIGGVLGGLVVHRAGINRALWIMGFLQALSTAFFAFLTDSQGSIPLLIAIIGFENLTAGMGTSAYAAFMGSMTNIKFSATQYALLSSLMAIPSAIFSARTGAMSENLGWSGFFLFCALIALPGMFLIPFLRVEPSNAILKSLKFSILTGTVFGGIYALYLNAADLINLFASHLKN
jgi:PAT family beta-lactamase induction signal transducer AmpG